MQLSSKQSAADHIHRVAMFIEMVEDCAQSEGQAKMHQSAREILCETGIPRSSVHRIIYRDQQLKCFKRRCAQLLSEANCVTRLTP